MFNRVERGGQFTAIRASRKELWRYTECFQEVSGFEVMSIQNHWPEDEELTDA